MNQPTPEISHRRLRDAKHQVERCLIIPNGSFELRAEVHTFSVLVNRSLQTRIVIDQKVPKREAHFGYRISDGQFIKTHTFKV